MKILDIRTYTGPNVFNHDPVLVMALDLEILAGRESREFPGFNDELLRLLPDLHQHVCAAGCPGGFVRRLETGTYFGHIVEHIAIELSQGVGAPVNYGKTVLASSANSAIYHVVVAYQCEPAMRALLSTSVELTQAILDGRDYPLTERVAQVRRLVSQTSLGPTTAAILDTATRRGIPHLRINDGSLLQLGYGKYRQLIQASLGSRTGAVAVDIAGDKQLTKDLLERALIPVPRGRITESVEDAIEFLEELGRAIVLKPVDGHQGVGVRVGLENEADVREAFISVAEFSRKVLVEELLPGRDYRVLIVGNKLVAASERCPPVLIGDGRRTVRELLDQLNQDPRRGEFHDRPLSRVTIDDALHHLLAMQRLDLDAIPDAGSTIRLRATANLSTGATAVDVTDLVHPDTSALCIRAAQVVGLDICGLDLIVPDISERIPDDQPAIIELNAAPGIRMHHFPVSGEPRDVGGAIVNHLFPPGVPSRIPVVAVTGTNGKTTVTRMVAHVLSNAGFNLGMTSTDGVMIGGRTIARGDLTGARSARAVLSDPSVDAAVLETARGGIVRQGLGYDWADVAVVTNVQLDHVGQDGIESIDDLAHVKALVAERVREGGRLVLNADDPHSAAMADRALVRRVAKQVVYYSLYPDHLVMRNHLDHGGTGYLLEDGWLVEARGRTRERILRVRAVPATMYGLAAFNVSNLLAAVAACRGLSLPPDLIANALARFQTGDNPGRANLYAVRGAFVILDYGHNPAAFSAVSALASGWERGNVTAVIGVPGDRDDSVIVEAGRTVAKAFYRIIIREDDDRRGREVGETASLLLKAIRHYSPHSHCAIVLEEAEAFRAAIRRLHRGDVAVLFYEKLDRALKVLAEFGARPVKSIPRLRLPQFAETEFDTALAVNDGEGH